MTGGLTRRIAEAERGRALAEPIAAGRLAWALALPLGALTVLVVKYVGPPLGSLIAPSSSAFTFFDYEKGIVHPESAEQGRYLLLLGAPVLFAAVVRLLAVPPRRLRAVAVGAGAARVALAVLVVACFVAQYRLRIQYGGPTDTVRARYFMPATLVVSAAIALMIALAVRSEAVVALAARVARDSRVATRAVRVAVVLVATASVLPAVNSDRVIRWTNFSIAYTTQFPFDETFAVINGRTPLVDFTTQYASLWPFVASTSMRLFGSTLMAFTITLAAISAVALMALFGVLRRVTRSRLSAFALFVPVVAACFFRIEGDDADRFSPGTYLALYPLRYAAPLLLAWLTARYLARPDGERRTWPLFVLAGLTAINNLDFGLAAMVATVGAIAWTSRDSVRATAARIAKAMAVGLTVALGLVAAVTLARTGSLPQLGRLLDYPRMYAAGYILSPLPGILGLHLLIYVTYVGAIGAATVRALARERNVVLTGMLAWSGIFGLGAGAYFAAESGRVQLTASFTPWALTLALLAVAVLEGRAIRERRVPRLEHLAVLFGVGILVCSLPQLPAPWSQLQRLRAKHPSEAQASFPSIVPDASMRNFFASVAYGPRRFYLKPHAPAAILAATGHRVADTFGIVNVAQYTGIDSIHTRERLYAVIRELRRAGGNTLFVPGTPELRDLLLRWGFLQVTRSGLSARREPADLVAVSGLELNTWTKWVDGHHLRPRFLRGDRGTPVRGY